MTKEGVPGILDAAVERLTSLDGWDAESIETGLRALLTEIGVGVGKGLQPMRVAVTGSSVSPPLFESMAVLGRDRTVERLQNARNLLSPA
jgi:glutamyl-tRNA synthetase